MPPAHAALEAARPPRAAAPAPGDDALRTAYLELLKLTLCDLAGTTTTSVGTDPDGVTMAHELEGEGLRQRAAGLDWPFHGLTMVGLQRLDDLQRLMETLVADGVPGDVIEAGTWRGGASILMRATLDALGDERGLVVADSFQGFPEPVEGDTRDALDLAAADFLAVTLDEVRGNFARFGLTERVEFVPGFFEHTLHGLAGRQWSLLRLDGDTYSATWTALDALYPDLAVGGYVVIDDFGALEECRDAVHAYRAHHGITEPIEEIDWTGARWRRTRDAPVAREGIAAEAQAAVVPQGVHRAETHVPTLREVLLTRGHEELAGEVERLRARLAAAEAEIAALHAAPLRAARAWARGKRGAGK